MATVAGQDTRDRSLERERNVGRACPHVGLLILRLVGEPRCPPESEAPNHAAGIDGVSVGRDARPLSLTADMTVALARAAVCQKGSRQVPTGAAPFNSLVGT